MRYLVVLTSIFLTQFNIVAQTGSITVEKDRRIDGLVEKQGLAIPPETRQQVDGYRIQLFFDQEKDALNEARSQFISKYHSIETYVEYRAPYYYLKAGDFRTHLEAVRIKSSIEELFPTSFILKELIYLPNMEKETLKN